MNSKELLHKILEEIDAARHSRPEWFRPYVGICCNVADLVYDWEDGENITSDDGDQVNDLLEELTQQWPGRHKEVSCYPVGGEAEYLSETDMGTHWDNPRRIELLHWLIEETK